MNKIKIHLKDVVECFKSDDREHTASPVSPVLEQKTFLK